MILRHIFILIFLCFVSTVDAQTEVIVENELKLQGLFNSLNKENRQLNDSIRNLFENTLRLEGAFGYPFDSLKYVGKIYSDDEKIRIFTWNNVRPDGSNTYFGFILQRSGNNIRLHQLNDTDTLSADPSNTVYDAKNWYGSLIYDIVDIKISGETYYTVLAYDPTNVFIKRKFVDILWFRNGVPVFGKPVFNYRKRMQHRIIFEYSAKVQMSLTYNKDTNMIIFDHLAPTNQSVAGNPQYYVPDLSFDGLKFIKGIWDHVENIDARN